MADALGDGIRCTRGGYAKQALQVIDETGAEVGGFSGSETLAAQVWQGEDNAALFAPTATWKNATLGTVNLEFAEADTADLDPGYYPVMLTITMGGHSVPRRVATLVIEEAPGSATAGAVYCTPRHMLDYAPWLERLINPRTVTGWLKERARARSWLDDAILNTDRPDWGHYGRLPVDASFGAASGGWGLNGDTYPDKWLRDQLAADYLIVRDWVIEATARKAVSFVCENQLGEASEGTSYQTLAMRYSAIADSVLLANVAEIDTNGDGYPERWVRLCRKSWR